MFTTHAVLVQRIRLAILVASTTLAMYVFVPITLAAASGSPTPTLHEQLLVQCSI